MADEKTDKPPYNGFGEVRDITTHHYKVEKQIPALEGVESFKAWLWGDSYLQVEGLGPVFTKAQLNEWLDSGVIVEVKNAN